MNIIWTLIIISVGSRFKIDTITFKDKQACFTAGFNLAQDAANLGVHGDRISFRCVPDKVKGYYK